MSDKVLFVDDEANVLDAIRRNLRKQINLDTAVGPLAGLEKINKEGPFAVVVSDLKMPEMTGVEFLAKVREISPDTVRIMLTGEAELKSAIAAVNEGNIFRFLTKPVTPESLISRVNDALDQYRLVDAERQLLEETLGGAVTVLTEILGLVSPASFSRASRIKQYVENVATELNLPDQWQFGLAAMLSQIGCITLPMETLEKLEAGTEDLSEQEKAMFQSHPDVAGELLGRIPRLQTVAKMVVGQNGRVDQLDLPEDPLDWDPQVLGAQIIRLSMEFDRLVTYQGLSPKISFRKLGESDEKYPLVILNALEKSPLAKSELGLKMLGVAELATGMVLDEDVLGSNGLMLAPKGQSVNSTVLARLRNFAHSLGIKEPIRVLAPY